jgi:hypothetical protein
MEAKVAACKRHGPAGFVAASGSCGRHSNDNTSFVQTPFPDSLQQERER